MPGPSQIPNGLLTLYVQPNGHVEIHLGKVFYAIDPDNSDMQWIYRIRESLQESSIAFLKSMGRVER